MKNQSKAAMASDLPRAPNGKWIETNYCNQGTVFVDDDKVWGNFNGKPVFWHWKDWVALTAEVDKDLSKKGESARSRSTDDKPYKGLRFIKKGKGKNNGSNQRVNSAVGPSNSANGKKGEARKQRV